MTFKMNGPSLYKKLKVNRNGYKNMPDGRSTSSPFQATIKQNKSKTIEKKSTKEDTPQEYPGHGNPSTPDFLYKADGTKVSTAKIDEGELSADKTDDKGRHTTHSNGTKYYYKKP